MFRRPPPVFGLVQMFVKLVSSVWHVCFTVASRKAMSSLMEPRRSWIIVRVRRVNVHSYTDLCINLWMRPCNRIFIHRRVKKNLHAISRVYGQSKRVYDQTLWLYMCMCLSVLIWYAHGCTVSPIYELKHVCSGDVYIDAHARRLECIHRYVHSHMHTCASFCYSRHAISMLSWRCVSG